MHKSSGTVYLEILFKVLFNYFLTQGKTCSNTVAIHEMKVPIKCACSRSPDVSGPHTSAPQEKHEWSFGVKISISVNEVCISLTGIKHSILNGKGTVIHQIFCKY